MRVVSRGVFGIVVMLVACAEPGGGGGDGGEGSASAGEGDDDDDAGSDTGSGSTDGGQEGGGGDAGGNPTERPRDYIRGENFGRLVVEVDTAPGLEPRTGVSAEIEARFGAILDKPDGVEVRLHDRNLPSPANGVWTAEALVELGEQVNDIPTDGDTIEIHTMWLAGRYENENTLGTAWRNRHIAMFPEKISEFCTDVLLVGEMLCPIAETAIWTHEVGHVIGLVDNGVDMVADHEDKAHGKHDENRDCIMYWSYDGADALDLLNERVLQGRLDAPAFDQACLDDIAAVRDAG